MLSAEAQRCPACQNGSRLRQAPHDNDYDNTDFSPAMSRLLDASQHEEKQ